MIIKLLNLLWINFRILKDVNIYKMILSSMISIIFVF